MAETIRENDPINLRNSLLNVDFGLRGKFGDAHDLVSAWNGKEVTKDVLRYFGALFYFSHTYFNHPGSQAQSYDYVTKIINGCTVPNTSYVIYNGDKRTPMHIMNAQTIHETCKCSTLIQSFNHLGLCIGYDKVRRYHTAMATLTAEKTAMM